MSSRVDGASLPTPWVVVLPLVAAMATAGVSFFHTDPAARAETRFLALSIALGVAAIAAMGAGRDTEGRRGVSPAAIWVAFGAVAVVWLIYHGPRRGALVSGLLLLGMVVAGLETVRRRTDESWCLPAAFGLQVLARGELLLLPWLEFRKLASLVGLPLLAGLALVELARGHGRARALFAGAAVATLAPGWNLTTTSTLVAMALATRFQPFAGHAETEPGEPRTSSPTLRAWLALSPLLLLPFWRPMEGTLIAAAALAVALGRQLAWLGPLLALGVVLGGPRGMAFSGSPLVALERWLGGLALLPSALLAPLALRFRQRQGIVFLLAGVWAIPGVERADALAPGLVLLALAMPLRGALLGVQAAWSVAMLGGTVVLAAYPWSRETPRADWLALSGVEGGAAIVVPLVLVIGLGILLDLLGAALGRRWIPRPVALGAVLAAGGLLIALTAGARPATILVDHYRAVALDVSRPRLSLSLEGEPVSSVVVDSHLVHGVELPVGTEVARVVLRDDSGNELQAWPLRVGRDTAEWAAGRADVAARPGFVAPPPFITTVAPDGRFLTHRFRRAMSLARAVRPAEVVIERDAELAPAVVLVIYRLELRP